MERIIKIENMNMNNINHKNPMKRNRDIIIPLYYGDVSSNKSLLLQVPSLFINDSYNYKSPNRSLLLTLKRQTKVGSDQITKIFNDLDSKILDILKKKIYIIKKLYYNEIDLSKISYRTMVNEIDDSDEVYNNGVLKYNLINLTKVYDENKRLLNIPEYRNIMKGVYIKSIIEINSIVIRNNIAYVNLFPHQLRIVKESTRPIMLSEYSFIDSEEENGLEPNVIDGNDTEFDVNSLSEFSEMHDIEIKNKNLIKKVSAVDNEIKEHIIPHGCSYTHTSEDEYIKSVEYNDI